MMRRGSSERKQLRPDLPQHQLLKVLHDDRSDCDKKAVHEPRCFRRRLLLYGYSDGGLRYTMMMVVREMLETSVRMPWSVQHLSQEGDVTCS